MILLKTSSRLFKVIYIGPLAVSEIIYNFQYILTEIEGKVQYGIFHLNRYKQAYLRATKGPVNTLAISKQTLNLGIRKVLCESQDMFLVTYKLSKGEKHCT